METKITTASVRIALSHAYSTFEVSAQLENENGISNEDIAKVRKDIQKLATDAVNEYRIHPNVNAKEEVIKLENKVKELKQIVTPEKEIKDNATTGEIENLPLYKNKKASSK